MEVFSHELNESLLSAPFSLHNNTLLIKVVSTKVADSFKLSVFLIDTEEPECFIETLSPINLSRRIQKSFSQQSQSQSQSQSDYQQLDIQVDDVIREVKEGLADGSAEVTFNSISTDHILNIRLPLRDLTLSFICDSLGDSSPMALFKQLITPLLGLSSVLIRLVASRALLDDETLTAEFDASAKVEGLREGRALKSFFESEIGGGSSMLGRYCQRLKGNTLKRDLIPISLSNKNVRRSTSPSATRNAILFQAQASPSPTKPKIPITPPTHSFAQRILQGSTSKREQISWNETQSCNASKEEQNLASESNKKGKRKEEVLVENIEMLPGGSRMESKLQSDEGEEYSTQDEDLEMPPPQQTASNPVAQSLSPSSARNNYSSAVFSPSPTPKLVRAVSPKLAKDPSQLNEFEEQTRREAKERMRLAELLKASTQGKRKRKKL